MACRTLVMSEKVRKGSTQTLAILAVMDLAFHLTHQHTTSLFWEAQTLM